MLLTDDIKKEKLDRAFSGLRNVPDKLHRATQALFWENRHACRWKERDFYPPYNLGKRDHDDTLSMCQIYYQCSSEYEAAMVLLGDYDHWERLCNCNWFKKHIDKWREEKLRRDKALGRSMIVELAQSGNLAAAKYLDKLSSPKQEKPTVETPEENEVESIPSNKDNSTWATEMLKRVRN